MSKFFSCLLLPGGKVYWSLSEDSPQDLADSLGLYDLKIGTQRKFLYAFVPDGDMERYIPDKDQPDALPLWYTRHADTYRAKVAAIVSRLVPIHNKYERTIDDAWLEYERIRNVAWAEYVRILYAAGAERMRLYDEIYTHEGADT